jgi:hypothetical protein
MQFDIIKKSSTLIWVSNWQVLLQLTLSWVLWLLQRFSNNLQQQLWPPRRRIRVPLLEKPCSMGNSFPMLLLTKAENIGKQWTW